VAHADGAEWTAGSSPVEQVIPATLGIASPVYGTATALDYALRIFNEAQRLHNLHITYHNRGVASGTPVSYSSINGYVGYNVYAHKAAEASSTYIDPTVTLPLPAASVITAALVSACATLANDLMVQFDQGHRRNIKVSDGSTVAYHATADTFNALGTTVAISTSLGTGAQLAERANLLQTVIINHLLASSGGVPHSSADSARAATLAAITPVQGPDDWDGIMTVLIGCKTAYAGHRADAGIHAAADSHNVVTAASPSYPSTIIGSGTLPRVFKTNHNAHTTAVDGAAADIHLMTDSANQLAYSNPTTIATLVSAAAEVYTKQTAHFRSTRGLAVRESA
jgi:hypothetical protein